MKTKEHLAQQYAEEKTAAAFDYVSPNIDTAENLKIPVFTGEQIKQAYLDGYAACEQSMWRSVEEELPQQNGDYLICTEYGEIEIAFWEDNYWLGNDSYPVRNVIYWRELPSLPGTNTEKK